MRFLDRLAEFSILTKLAILLSLSFVLISSLALLIFLPTVSSSKIKPNFLPYQHFLPGTAGYIIENPNLTDIRAMWVVPKVNCFKSYTDTPHLVNQGLLLSSVTENSDFSNLNSALVVTSSNCSQGAAVYELTIRIGKYTVDINAGNTIKAEVKLLESKKTQQTYTLIYQTNVENTTTGQRYQSTWTLTDINMPGPNFAAWFGGSGTNGSFSNDIRTVAFSDCSLDKLEASLSLI